MNLFYAVAIVFGILMMLILGTPQGAIRWNLFFMREYRRLFIVMLKE